MRGTLRISKRLDKHYRCVNTTAPSIIRSRAPKSYAYPAENQMARLQRDISEMAGVEVNMLVLTLEKMKSIKKAEDCFRQGLSIYEH